MLRTFNLLLKRIDVSFASDPSAVVKNFLLLHNPPLSHNILQEKAQISGLVTSIVF